MTTWLNKITMADGSGVWNRSANMLKIDPNEKLFLFGYSCKIFRDDEKAKYIDQGKHLIPWMGDESLMIDRYDVRGYLHDLKQYEPNSDVPIQDLDLEEEKLCDEERYRSLRSDMSEEQLYQEEELKRLRAAIASDSAYHEIGFSYDNEVEKFSEPEGPKEEPEELYEAPSGLNVPKGMEVPYNMKIHAIIERTAMFVSEQGGQMEIIIKMKQQNNPQFGFMHLDNPLYPYYKFLLKEIKSGAYKPVPARRVSRSEDEDEDGHYLHPSLLAGKKENIPKFTVPSINFRRSQDDSYSVLVRNLQQQLVEEKLAKEKESVPETPQRLVNYSLDESNISDSLNNSQIVQVIPPPEIQPIIQKMAEYVAKNGEDFEYVVKSKKDKRFEFLQPSSEYYSYYIHLRDDAKVKLQPPSAAKLDSATASAEMSSTSESHLANAAQLDNLNHSEGHEEVPAMDEFDALYAEDSQDLMFRPQVAAEDHSNSADSLDSLGLPRESSKSKNPKVPKGPISFSLRAKEPDTVPTEKTKIPLLLDDSDEDSGAEGEEKSEPSRRRRKSTEDRSAPTSRHHSVEREEKPKMSSEMEAKLAEERMKDKLLSAARERMVQQKREKRLEQERQKREEQLKKEKQLQVEQQRKERQLQLERKKKAALFLKMLKSRNPELNIEDQQKSEKSDFWNMAVDAAGEENGILFPLPKLATLSRRRSSNLAIPGIKSDWSGSSASEESGEEIMITEFCSNPDPVPLPNSAADPVPLEKSPEPQRKHEHKRKRKKRSKSRERRRRSSRSRRSRSPRNSRKSDRTKKGKELPAAYALVDRGRSRSRSPRRYRQNPYWNRRR